MKHSTAPWVFEKSDFTIRTMDFKSNAGMGDYRGVIICNLDPENWRGIRSDSIPEKEANGRLIENAPDLLNVCKLALNELENLNELNQGEPDISETINKLKSVLNKI